jgi:hypothetical protein
VKSIVILSILSPLSLDFPFRPHSSRFWRTKILPRRIILESCHPERVTDSVKGNPAAGFT